MTVLPDTQLALRPGAVEMRGDPDPVLLPAAQLAEGARRLAGVLRQVNSVGAVDGRTL